MAVLVHFSQQASSSSSPLWWDHRQASHVHPSSQPISETAIQQMDPSCRPIPELSLLCVWPFYCQWESECLLQDGKRNSTEDYILSSKDTNLAGIICDFDFAHDGGNQAANIYLGKCFDRWISIADISGKVIHHEPKLSAGLTAVTDHSLLKFWIICFTLPTIHQREADVGQERGLGAYMNKYTMPHYWLDPQKQWTSLPKIYQSLLISSNAAFSTKLALTALRNTCVKQPCCTIWVQMV